MSLDNILSKILAEGQAEASRVTAEAAAKAQAALAEARAQVEQRRAEILAQARREADEYELRQLTMAGLEARKALLTARQGAIDTAFSQALSELRKVPAADYRQLLKSMLLDLVETGNEQVIVDQADRSFFTEGFLTEVNQELTNMGKQGNLSLSPETRETGGGFILATGEIDINATFITRLKELREELEPAVAKILFM